MDVSKSAAGAEPWRAQVPGAVDPLVDPTVAFTAAGVVTVLAGVGAAFASRGSGSALISGLGTGTITGLLTGAGALMLSREREGMVDNPAFDAERLLARDQDRFHGSSLEDGHNIQDENGTYRRNSYVDDVHGVFRTEAAARDAVDHLNDEPGDTQHVVAMIRDVERSGIPGVYQTETTSNHDFAPGTDDVYSYLAVSLQDDDGPIDVGTGDGLRWVPDADG